MIEQIWDTLTDSVVAWITQASELIEAYRVADEYQGKVLT